MLTDKSTYTPMVKVENLSHRYTTQWAVKNVSFELNKNEIIGLLGSNGAGKSTLMNVICGVLSQTEGLVEIDGKNNVEQRLQAKKMIGFLPQKPPLQMDLTVEEFLYFAANLRVIPRKMVKKSVENAMVRCGIKHFRNRLIKNLSGGYQQRVGIAQAIIHNPKFIVLDEPTNGLDPNQILEIRNLIKEIARDRIVLLSTHILQEVQAMCHHIYMMEMGEMVFDGTIDEFNNSIKSNALILLMNNPPSLEAIKELEGVSNAEYTNDNRIRCSFKEDTDIHNLLINTSINKGWELQEIYKEKINPDEIFKYFSMGKKEKVANEKI